MAIQFRTVTGSLKDLLAGNPRVTKAWVETNLAQGEVPIDLTNNQLLFGGGLIDVSDVGSISVGNLIDFAANDATEVNPVGVQYRFHVKYTDVATGRRGCSWNSGWLSITADANIATLLATQYAPPTWQTSFTEAMEAIQAAAAAEAAAAAASAVAAAASAVAAAASAALADSYIVADLNTSDGQVEALIESPSSLTRGAIDGRFGEETGVPAGIPTSFTANGTSNNFLTKGFRNSRGFSPVNSYVEGDRNNVFEYASHGEGSTVKADGKISHAEGNACICTANDSHAEGNRTVAGRRQYRNITAGSEDAGDGLGVLEYALIPDDPYGDVTSYFPNRFTDNVTTRYGAGASLDTLGNVYGSTSAASGVNTPATWDDPVTISLANNADLSDTAPDPTPLVENDLKWAMHSICILRGGPSETAIAYARIAKATYSAGVGTKVYYFGHYPGVALTGYSIYSSYSPVVLRGGNGQHAEGFQCSSWDYGSHAEGQFTRAWANGAHSEGRETAALAAYSHAGGYQTTVNPDATGARATGANSVADRTHEEVHASGKRLVDGDSQTSVFHTSKSHDSAVGWGVVPLYTGMTDGSFHFDSMVLGRQTGGTGGTVGDTFAYRFSGVVVVASGAMTVLGEIVRELKGRSTTMSGDGLTTGPRLSVQNTLYTAGAPMDSLIVRFDADADTITWIQARTTVQLVLA